LHFLPFACHPLLTAAALFFVFEMSIACGSQAKNKNHSPLLCEPAGSASVPIRVVDKKK